MGKGILKLIAIIIILLAIVGGSYYLLSGGDLSIPLLAAYPNAITFEEYNSGQCRYAMLQHATISCDYGPQASLGTFNVGENQVFNYKVDFDDSKIESASISSGALNVYDGSSCFCSVGSTSYSCGYTSCIGKSLTRGKTYTFKAVGFGLGDSIRKATVEIWGRTEWLYYSSPDTGGKWKMPGTFGCMAQDWFANLRQLADEKSAPNIVSGTVSNISRTVNMEIGDSVAIPYAYVEKAPLNLYSYQNYLAHCDQYSKILKGFRKAEGIDGSCWAIPDSSIMFVQGHNPNLPNYVPRFCCNNDVCRGFGIDSVCRNYNCEIISTVPECTINADCGLDEECVSGTCVPKEIIRTNCLTFCSVGQRCDACGEMTFYTDATGQDYRVIPICNADGTCGEDKTEIGCSPLKSYGDLCCVMDDITGNYSLEPCEGKLSTCRSALGSTACCINTDYYTQQSCEAGLKCCGLDEETGRIEVTQKGIGTCKISCEAVPSPTCGIMGASCGSLTDKLCCEGLECVNATLLIGGGTCQVSKNGEMDWTTIAIIGAIIFGLIVIIIFIIKKL